MKMFYWILLNSKTLTAIIYVVVNVCQSCLKARKLLISQMILGAWYFKSYFNF